MNAGVGMRFFYILLIGLGFVSAFLMGRWGTLILLKRIAKAKNTKSAHIMGKLDQKNIQLFSFFGGTAAVVLFLTGLIKLPQKWFVPLLILCLGYGAYYLANVLSNRKRTPRSRIINEPIHTQANNRMTPEKPPEINLDELLKNRNWEWDCFRSVLIQLAKKGTGKYIPASNCPNYVHIDGLLPVITELRSISASNSNRESSRAVFVDTQRTCLVISGKTHIGTSSQVKIDLKPEPGRENVQIPVLTIHVHPGTDNTQGLSELDYASFLSDHRQVLMMICYPAGIIFSLKTSATSRYSSDIVQRRLGNLRKDILRIWSRLYPPDAILAFNKAVCLEFGLTLYRAPTSNESVAHRIAVTNL